MSTTMFHCREREGSQTYNMFVKSFIVCVYDNHNTRYILYTHTIYSVYIYSAYT